MAFVYTSTPNHLADLIGYFQGTDLRQMHYTTLLHACYNLDFDYSTYLSCARKYGIKSVIEVSYRLYKEAMTLDLFHTLGTTGPTKST